VAADQASTLEAARAGDGQAFAELVRPHRGGIRLHCYRMLGSFHDAEEATQEALLRAWSALGTYEARAPFSHWLYRIATTTCLMMIRAAGRRPQTVEQISHLEPYPDRLLDELAADSIDPAKAIERRESVALAFIAALQLLPATQRAAVVLKDVLGFSSSEIAEILNTTPAAVNSGLQRARAKLQSGAAARPALDPCDVQVLERFIDAWSRRDIDGLTALLSEDAELRMPPEPFTLHGPGQIIGFLSTVPAGGRLDLIPLLITAANGQHALAAYGPDHDGEVSAYGIMVLDLRDGLVAGITGFADAGLFPGFGLPIEFDGAATTERVRPRDMLNRPLSGHA
jgi:RNA polymerase sigma-70 factor (TIGR02960 family)